MCPLYQCPVTNSQIYAQAIRYNVTLLSFTHLGFLLRSDEIQPDEFDKIWKVSGTLKSGKRAVPYWRAIASQVVLACGNSIVEWNDYRLDSKRILHEQARVELLFWESEKERIRRMSHDQAVDALISSLRIDNNINTITRTIEKLIDDETGS